MKLTKQELEQRREWLRSNIEPLQSKLNQVEAELKKLDETEFDFQKLMPEGSVWLGCFKIRGMNRNTMLPEFSYIGTHKTQREIIYRTHQIVKAAIHYIESDGDGWHELNDAVLAAEHHGVLQNLE